MRPEPNRPGNLDESNGYVDEPHQLAPARFELAVVPYDGAALAACCSALFNAWRY